MNKNTEAQQRHKNGQKCDKNNHRNVKTTTMRSKKKRCKMTTKRHNGGRDVKQLNERQKTKMGRIHGR